VAQVRNYETEKAAHEKTRLELRKHRDQLLGNVRGLEAKVLRLEEALVGERTVSAETARRYNEAQDRLDEIVEKFRALVEEVSS